MTGAAGPGERGPLRFVLMRQDDHGQRYEVARYAECAAAEMKLAALSRVPHKQTYWIEEISGADRSAPATR